MQSIGRRIKELREASGITRTELAKRANVTRAYVSSLESGSRDNPSLDVLRRLANALKTDVSELLK